MAAVAQRRDPTGRLLYLLCNTSEITYCDDRWNPPPDGFLVFGHLARC